LMPNPKTAVSSTQKTQYRTVLNVSGVTGCRTGVSREYLTDVAITTRICGGKGAIRLMKHLNAARYKSVTIVFCASESVFDGSFRLKHPTFWPFPGY
jgi:hypothetical protein